MIAVAERLGATHVATIVLGDLQDSSTGISTNSAAVISMSAAEYAALEAAVR